MRVGDLSLSLDAQIPAVYPGDLVGAECAVLTPLIPIIPQPESEAQTGHLGFGMGTSDTLSPAGLGQNLGQTPHRAVYLNAGQPAKSRK